MKPKTGPAWDPPGTRPGPAAVNTGRGTGGPGLTCFTRGGKQAARLDSRERRVGRWRGPVAVGRRRAAPVHRQQAGSSTSPARRAMYVSVEWREGRDRREAVGRDVQQFSPLVTPNIVP